MPMTWSPLVEVSTTPTEVLLGESRPAVGVVHQRLRVTVTGGCTDLSAQDASAIGYRTRRARVNLRVGVDDRLGNGEQCLGSAWLSKTWDAIKHHSVNIAATITISGFASANPRQLVSCGQMHLYTAAEPVGAPIFYRDVPLMPSELEKGVPVGSTPAGQTRRNPPERGDRALRKGNPIRARSC